MSKLRESPNNPGLLIPIYHNGSMNCHTNKNIKEFDMDFEFKDKMVFKTAFRGRSAVTFVFKSTTNPFNASYDSFYMFLSDFISLVKQYDLRKPLDGRWKFRKAGQNFGIVYLGV